MLVQTFRRQVPERNAFIERTLVRGPTFCVAVLRTRLIALDRGVLATALGFPARVRRSQLSLVLEGRGYLDEGGRELYLEAGDLALCDQRLLVGEGYGGAASQVLILDWDDPARALPPVRGTAGRISASDLTWLLRHVGSLPHTPRDIWLGVLLARLRSAGLAPRMDSPISVTRSSSSAPLVRLYDGLGSILSRLDAHPTLTELASFTRTGERQTKRWLAKLTRDYAHSFESFRDFIHEMRLDWATQLLSVPGMTLNRVATLAGYRSTVALHHAFSSRGADTPRGISRRLKERWG